MITTDKAIERLAFTISKQNKPNQTDLDALKIIAEFVENSKKQEVTRNYLFAKLYVNTFLNETLFLKDSLNNGYVNSQKIISRILKLSLKDNIKYCMDKLNEHEFWLFCESIGFKNSTAKIRTEEEIEIDDQLKNKHQEDFLKYGLGVHDYEQFEEKIKDQVNFCINQFKRFE